MAPRGRDRLSRPDVEARRKRLVRRAARPEVVGLDSTHVPLLSRLWRTLGRADRSFAPRMTMLRQLRHLVLALALALSLALASAASATDFRAGFETGSIAPWDEIQYEFDRPLSESFSVVTSPVRKGRYAARFTATQGYSPFGWGEATELLWGSNETEGSDYWYAWSTMFPPGWQAPYGWGIFAEWHSKYSVPPPLSFDARQDAVWVSVYTGLVGSGGGHGFTLQRRILSTLSPGHWNDFVLHVKWSSQRTGAIQVWSRVQGQREFAKRFDLKGIPTLQHDAQGPLSNYTLFGIYRGSYCGPDRTDVVPGCTGTGGRGTQPPSVLYEDSFTRGTSFADVANAAFPDRPPVPLSLRPARQSDGEHKHASHAHRKTLLRLGTVTTVRDAGCAACSVVRSAAGVTAVIGGGLDTVDTAYARRRLGGAHGWTGRVFLRDSLRMPKGQALAGNLSILQMRDAHSALVYELYVAPDRTLRLFSPAGGLGAGSVNASTGVSVVDGRPHRIEVSAAIDRSVTVRVGGLDCVSVQALSGAPQRKLRYLRIGIDHYDGTAAAGAVRVYHASIALSREYWLGTSR